MRTTPLVLFVAVLGLTGCRSRAYSPPAAPAAAHVVAAAPVAPAPVVVSAPATPPTPAAPAPERTVLRYHDMRDLTEKRGIVVLRGPRSLQDRAEEHIQALREIVRESEAHAAARATAPKATPEATPNHTVMIHAVADLVEGGHAGTADGAPQQELLAGIRENVEGLDDAVLRFQGGGTIVVKAEREAHERIAAYLDGLRDAATPR